MSWLPLLAIAAAAFLFALFVLKLPRPVWMLFGAALLFGLAGYALQGSPDQPGAPKAAAAEQSRDGELMIAARREFFDPNQPPARFVVTADAFARRGAFENSANFLRNAVEENPQDGEAWVALGNALVEHAGGQLNPAALYAYSRAEEVLPGNPAPGYFVGLALLRSGQPLEARKLWARLVEEAEDDAEWRPMIETRLARLDALIAQMASQ